ncbi:hypothetical protein NIES970_07690 [[Synechococcus] sp. NIES-970]|nr:hypothetical protein NIES970_07690 [[Synechococcus] sp. NIES-970]
MKVKFLSTGGIIKLSVFLLLAFIAVGDLFLPEPLKGASKEIKTTLNEAILSIFPQKRFQNPNERTEEAVEEVEETIGR